MRFVAGVVVLLAGAYLVVLGVTALVAPTQATRFLSAFAGSRSLHFAELALRALVGAALVACAPGMRVADVVVMPGWMLLLTTGVLVLMPWRWHQRFARWSVPRATERPALIGCGSLVGGGVLLYALFTGPAPPR